MLWSSHPNYANRHLETSTKEEVGYLVFPPFLGREDGHHLVQCQGGIYVDVPHARSPPPEGWHSLPAGLSLFCSLCSRFLDFSEVYNGLRPRSKLTCPAAVQFRIYVIIWQYSFSVFTGIRDRRHQQQQNRPRWQEEKKRRRNHQRVTHFRTVFQTFTKLECVIKCVLSKIYIYEPHHRRWKWNHAINILLLNCNAMFGNHIRTV